MERRVRLGLALAFCACLGATCEKQSDRASLAHVHDVYASEFAETIVPATGASCVSTPLPEVAAGPPAFEKTLAAIRELQAKPPEDEAVSAHLTVLEGMVYVQSGRIGLAKSALPDVQAAAAKLQTATGLDARDALLARSFPYLVTGWERVQALQASGQCAFPEESPAALETAADGIRAELASERANERLASSEADAGALYLATTAAIFYVWDDKIRDDGCMRTSTEASRACRAIYGTKYLERGRDLVAQNLPPACTASPPASGCDPSLARYVDWYRFLDAEVERHD
jgi:hypothetical protein